MSTEDSGKSRYWSAAIVVFLGLPILLCGGMLSWWVGRRAIAANELEDRRAEIVARGLPIDDQSISDFRYQQMSHQYSERWMRVLDRLGSKPFTQSAVGIPIVGVAEDEQPFVPGQPYKHDGDVRDFLAQWAELLAEIHEITEGSGPIWTEIQFDSFNTLLPYIQLSREAARVLSLEYQDAVRRDDRDQVFHSLMAMIGVSRSLQEEPLIISQLVQIALGAIATRNLKQAIELDLLNEDQLLQILEQLKAMDDCGSRFRIAIAGERALSQPVFDDPHRLGQQNVANVFGARPIDALAALEILGRAESIETEDLGDFLADTQKLESDLQREMSQANLLKKYDTALTGLTIPALAGYGKAVVRGAMEMRIAKLAIGLRWYEKRNDRWPNTLDELEAREGGIDLGAIQPVGPKAFGFRVRDGTAEVWGFHPEHASDMTPEEPVDSLTLQAVDPISFQDHQQDIWEYWHWKLSRAQ
jgi:hypothetical protein